LLEALSRRLGLPQEHLLAGAGADELIDLFMRLLIEPGDAILNCPPTFSMYAFDGNLNNARVINIPRRPNFSLDLDRILASVREVRPKIIFLASPNNPDGSLIPNEQLEQLLALPVILVLDEAYIEFAPPGSSVIGQVAERSNLVVLRTFSKWAGLAGLRIGYGAFPAGLTEHLWKIKQPYNVSTAASTAALVSLQHSADLEETGRQLVAERQRLFEQLRAFPWLRPYPSQANYILCRVVGKDAAGIKNDLASQGILVRYFNKPGLQDHIRISVGKPEHTNALLAALKRY
jgi:histidinol-phosphate aminotransferase